MEYANPNPIITPLLFLLIIFLYTSTTTPAVATTPDTDTSYYRSLSAGKLGLKKEKLSHLCFFFHDILVGRDPTATVVASSEMTNKSRTLFGAVVVADEPLTLTPEMNSTMVGRAQGIYASAGLEETALLMVMNLGFTQGKYKGSSLTLLGRNQVFSAVREMPIIGGSGLFRFARGYAQAKTRWVDIKTGNAVIEYNIYVLHY